MRELLKRFWEEEDGQGMVEYGLIIALVSVVLIGALVGLSDGLESIFGEATDELESPTESSDDL